MSNLTKENFNRQFQEYLRVAYEGRWYILSIFLLVVTATWFYTLQQDDVFVAKSSIRIKKTADLLGNQSFKGLVDQDLGFSAERIVSNEIRVITSEGVAKNVADNLIQMADNSHGLIDSLPSLKSQSRPSTLRKIARSLGLENTFVSMGLMQLDTNTTRASMKTVINRIRRQMEVSPVKNVDFIEIAIESSSPREAEIIANLVVDAYRLRNLEAARLNLTKAKEFLEGQLGSKRDSLNRAEIELRSFQQNAGLVSLDEESKSLINQLTTFEAQREQARIELRTSQRVLEEYQTQLKKIEPNLARKLTGISDPYLKQLLQDKASLENQITLAEYNRANQVKDRPDLIPFMDKSINENKQRLAEVNRKIEEISQRLQDSDDLSATPVEDTRELKNKIITQEIAIQALMAKLSGLDKTLTQFNQKFESLPEQSLQFARLERARQSNEKVFAILDQRYQEAVINEQTTLGTVDIVDRAIMPDRPVRPNRPLNMLIGVLVALGLGFGVALLLRYLDNTIRNPDDVEKIGLPVLTFIPTYGGGRGRGLNRSESLVTINAPQSATSEAYRTMRTAIENTLAKGNRCLTVIITSPAPKEGKSTAIANLAVSAATSGRRVLLIDADLRRPVQHSIFNLDREPGLSDCLVGKVPVNLAVKKTEIPRLHVATCGEIPSHPAELLGSVQMEKFVRVMKQYYDLILIDMPPVISMADTLVLARHADGVCLMVSADQTKILGLQKAKEAIEANLGRVIGVVVNRFNANKIYYSYYRYYYQNYYYYSDDGEKKIANREG